MSEDIFSSLPTLQCGSQFTICIDDKGQLWSFGTFANINGYCGINTTNKIIYPPEKINKLNNIQYISCGSVHVICCDYNGKVFSFGDNFFGQLGLNKSKEELRYSHIPQQINLPPIKQISCGLQFSMCLSQDGELWSFGQNSKGELGIGNRNNSFYPLKINNLSNIDYIICGGFFCFCKTIINDYYSWGNNENGQLIQENIYNITIPNKCINIPDNIISIKAGLYHVLFLTSDGNVYSCGNNTYGQLGHGNNKHLLVPLKIESLPFIKKISCGYNHSLCIDINNNLWVFGHNFHGQLGLGNFTNKNIPIKYDIISNILDISYGANTTFINTFDNKIYAFGDNSKLQVGLKTKEKKIKEPIQINIENIWKTNISNNRKKSARK